MEARTRKWVVGIVLVAALIAFPACGRFGEKGPVVSSAATAGGGCLDEFGPQMERFIDGTVEAEAWETTWDCAIDQLQQFQRFVKP